MASAIESHRFSAEAQQAFVTTYEQLKQDAGDD